MDPRTILARAAAGAPARPAVLCAGVAHTYPEIARLAGDLGDAFLGAGARPGGRVAAFLPNCHVYLAAYFAALERDLVLVPLNTRLAGREIEAVLKHSGATAVVATAADLARADVPAGAGGLASLAGREAVASGAGWVVVAAPHPDDEAAPSGAAHLYYTSGTTGRPKGVVLTRDNLAAHAAMTLDELKLGERDVWLHAAPMFHLADAWAVWTATAAGATHVMLPRWEAAAALRAMNAAGVTLTNLVPSMIPGLLSAATGTDTRPPLRLLLSGGAPMSAALVRRIESTLGCPYAQTYGLTETSPFLTFSFPAEGHRDLTTEARSALLARTGRAARGVRLRVVTPPGAGVFADVPADDRTVGEVVVRGATVTPGYWRDPEATAQAFLGGWFHTGDLGVIDSRGSLVLVDRAKDAIVTGGETVYSIEVESVLLEHPGVREAAVFGVPDPDWGEAVRAAVVLEEGSDAGPATLADFCRSRIAAYKCPRAVDLVAALPRTGTGKTDKRALREPFWAGRDRRIN
jgi:acyl-CoA synthetase (AMP-forming)/AMP-acid ligase II